MSLLGPFSVLLADDHVEWDVHCPGLVEAQAREAEWEVKEKSNLDQWGAAREVDNNDAGGWNIPEDDPHHQAWDESDNLLVTSFLHINRGWPSMEAGVEVSIEVHSDLKDSEEECPACRSPIFMGCFSVLDLLSFLCYSTIGTSGGSYTPPRSLSPKSMLPAALSEALGISLSEVMDCYLNGWDEAERVCMIEDALDRRRTLEEAEEWLAGEAHRMSVMIEQIHRGRDDDSF
jgi:hypothetical protein